MTFESRPDAFDAAQSTTTLRMLALSEELGALASPKADALAPPALLEAVRLVQSDASQCADMAPLRQALRARIATLVGDSEPLGA